MDCTGRLVSGAEALGKFNRISKGEVLFTK